MRGQLTLFAAFNPHKPKELLPDECELRGTVTQSVRACGQPASSSAATHCQAPAELHRTSHALEGTSACIQDVPLGQPQGSQQAGNKASAEQPSATARPPLLNPTASTTPGPQCRKSEAKQQLFTDFLVYDFEATTDEARKLIPVELIEFSCCLLDAQSLTVTAEFQVYLRPTENPILTAFCTQLTGITQDR